MEEAKARSYLEGALGTVDQPYTVVFHPDRAMVFVHVKPDEQAWVGVQALRAMRDMLVRLIDRGVLFYACTTLDAWRAVDTTARIGGYKAVDFLATSGHLGIVPIG